MNFNNNWIALKIESCFKNGQCSLKELSNDLIEIISKKLQAFKIKNDNIYIKNQYFVDDCMLKIYNSKKVVLSSKNVHQIKFFLINNFSKKIIEQMLANINDNLKFDQESFRKKNQLNDINEANYFQLGIGGDESGKGDFFGGIVVCVCYLDHDVLQKIKDAKILHEIKDSKKISNSTKLIFLAEKLMKILTPKRFVVKSFRPEKYNQFYLCYKNSLITLSNLYLLALKKLLLHQKISNFLLIDQYVSFNKFCEYYKKISLTFFNQEREKESLILKNLKLTPKAESKYLVVAMASIIARYHFITQIATLRKKSNLMLPFGCSYLGKNNVIVWYQMLLNLKLEDKKFCKADFQKVYEKLKQKTNF